jgi:hypothetical protein
MRPLANPYTAAHLQRQRAAAVPKTVQFSAWKTFGLAVFICLVLLSYKFVPGSHNNKIKYNKLLRRRAIVANQTGAAETNVIKSAEDSSTITTDNTPQVDDDDDNGDDDVVMKSAGIAGLVDQAIAAWRTASGKRGEEGSEPGTETAAAPSPTSAPLPFVVVPRDPSWVAEQRPIPGGIERQLSGHIFEKTVLYSENPPLPFDQMGISDAAIRELQNRLVVAIALGVHSGINQVASKGISSLPIFDPLISSFLPNARPNHIYRYVNTV